MNRFYFRIQISPNPSLLKRGIRANTFTVSEASLPKSTALGFKVRSTNSNCHYNIEELLVY